MFRLLARFLGLTLALAVGLTATAYAGTVKGDLAHSSAEFVVTHLTISKVHGTIPLTSWQAAVGTDFIPSSIEATLDATGIDTHDADRDKDLRGAAWFETDKYPTISFKSTKITPGTAGNFKITGDLTLHGVTKPVTLDAQYVGSVVDGRGHTHVGYTGTTTLDRRDFNLSWGMTMPGGQLIAANDVVLNIQAEGIIQKP